MNLAYCLLTIVFFIWTGLLFFGSVYLRIL
jgi:hypothetical protein